MLSRYWRDAVKAAGGAAHQAARRLAHLRDFDAPARDSGGGDRGVDRPQGRQPDDAAYAHSQNDTLKLAGE